MELKIEYVAVDKLTPYEKNTRRHEEKDIENIAKSIEKYGMNDAIGIWGKGNVIVEGHGRWLACKMLGLEYVPCVRLDHLTDKERKEYAIAHNATAELSGWDFEILSDEIMSLDLEDFDFDFGLEFDTEKDENEKFAEKMKHAEEMEEDDEYKNFLEKFEAKKTTDDCYTPSNIYEAVKKWCVGTYYLEGAKIIRPFYPGGDYKRENYNGDCVIIDNPPFSIISEICDWYSERNIRYFLFAPTLTLLGINKAQENYVVTHNDITYENGAEVNTSFVTNLGSVKITASPELHEIIERENKINREKMRKQLPKYEYPPEVLTVSMIGYMAQHGVKFEINARDVYFIRSLDSQKEKGKGLFGSGFLLSEKAAAEKAAAMIWELSDREWKIIKSLGRGEDGE